MNRNGDTGWVFPQVEKMISQIALVGVLWCFTLQPGFLDATSLMKIAQNEGPAPAPLSAVSLEAEQAHGFLSRPRPKRNVDPKWYNNPPDFHAYYKYYNNIGHIEGLYEIDRIRMLYQQMRHLEQVYGPDASKYQNLLGVPPAPKCDPAKDKKCKAPVSVPGASKPPPPPPPPTTPPPPPPPPPMSQADVVYLCNPKDPLCRPHLVYLPTGAVPVLCDPRYDPACKPKTDAPPSTSAPPPSPKNPLAPTPPPAAPIVIKGMEYDCDPYWDPDCLIDHPPPPVKSKTPIDTEVEIEGGEEDEEEEEAMPTLKSSKPLGKNKKPAPFLYDYQRELFDPYLFSKPAPDPE
ncbi:hypothetical protein GJAV_G00127950 [Gymnothorax javanicus]|nr:hypothetical protein GJAV_G00127950 [Gymnothorax javanicus]